LTKGNILKLRILTNSIKLLKEMLDYPSYYNIREPALSRLEYLYKKLKELYDLESGLDG